MPVSGNVVAGSSGQRLGGSWMGGSGHWLVGGGVLVLMLQSKSAGMVTPPRSAYDSEF